MERIYHHYEKWEDFRFGFYDNVSGVKKQELIKKAIEMFSSCELTEKYMNRVIEEWKYSCEHNLSNDSMNRVAYLGQAACALYAFVPNIITMNAWNTLDSDVRNMADMIAEKTIKKWERNLIYKSTLMYGCQGTTKMGFQTKLQLN